MNKYLVVARPADDNPHRARALYDGNSQDRARGAYDDPGGLPDGRWTIEARARVGSVSRRIGGALLPCDDWDAAPFRLEGHHADVAVRVEVTGRKVRRIPGSIDGRGVRVRITFVGDGRPDTTAGGWMFV